LRFFVSDSLLINGINYRREQKGEVKFTQTLFSLLDFLQLPGTEISAMGGDGTNTWITLKVIHMEPILLKHENDDKLTFTISEDLSGLLRFRISAGCKVEYRDW